MNTAFDRLRRHVRTHNALLSDIARQVIETHLATNALDAPAS